jgi:hypothetical protein
LSAESTSGGSLTPAEVERFFSDAVRRIPRFVLLISAFTLLPLTWFFGIPAAIGFTAGALISWVNFRSLARAVKALGDRIVDQHSRERGSIVVFRFLLRYLFVAVIAYAIFKGSPGAFRGFLFGLCAPVAAMLVEAVYEGYMALRKGY